MAAISDGTLCCCCAEPLEWTAFGVCNHKDACSKCVARWRFVLKDNRCIICKCEQPSIFITRYMGDFTARLTPTDFAALPAQAQRGELYHLPSIEAYTEDQMHYQMLKALCGYTHPYVDEKCAEAERNPPTFSSLDAMQRFIQKNYNLKFCSLCVEGRPVFLCEQMLYNSADLDRHNKIGDKEGPLAESGFKGHPACQFCRGCRFYDSNDLYRHMEGSHEHCFICRRERPNQFVYYRHYDELEGHFRRDHYLCMHPVCLDKKFVVFPTESELKRHTASEHGDELKMSRAQRREAMSLPVNIQIRSSAEEEARLAALARPGVVIGGGFNTAPRRANNRAGQAAAGMTRSESEGQMQAALQASYEQGPSSVTFDASDFPAVSGSGGAGVGGGQYGRWAGAAGAAPSAIRDEEFPELPSMSKADKKRMRQQQTPLVDRLRTHNMPVRVVHRSSGAASSSAAATSNGAGTSASSSRPPESSADPFPQLAPPPRHLGGQAAVRQQQQQQQQQQQKQRQQQARSKKPRTPELDGSDQEDVGDDEEGEEAFPALGGRPAAAVAAAGPRSAGAAPSRGSPPPVNREDEFPSLTPSTPSRGPRAPPPPPAPLHYTTSAPPNASAAASRAASASTAQRGAAAAPAPSGNGAPISPDDFPTLGGKAPSVRPLSVGQWQSKSSKKGAQKAQSQPVPTPNSPRASRPSTAAAATQRVPSPSPSTPFAVSGGAAAQAGSSGSGAEQGGGVSDGLKAANKALVSKIRTQLGGDGATFTRFKDESRLFMQEAISAEQYHLSIVALGLLPLVSELAALCPQEKQRMELLRAHRAYLASPAANAPGPGWVPPEAAAAMAAEAEGHASWNCKRCTLVNAPQMTACEMCGATREGVIPALDLYPALPTSSSSSRGGASASTSAAAGASPAADGAKGGKKGKGTKITIGLGSGNARAAAEAVTADPSKQAWTNGGSGANNAALRQAAQARRAALANPGSSARGQWAQSSANNLASQIGIMQDAWGSR